MVDRGKVVTAVGGDGRPGAQGASAATARRRSKRDSAPASGVDERFERSPAGD